MDKSKHSLKAKADGQQTYLVPQKHIIRRQVPAPHRVPGLTQLCQPLSAVPHCPPTDIPCKTSTKAPAPPSACHWPQIQNDFVFVSLPSQGTFSSILLSKDPKSGRQQRSPQPVGSCSPSQPFPSLPAALREEGSLRHNHHLISAP